MKRRRERLRNLYPKAEMLDKDAEAACHDAMRRGDRHARERLIASGYQWSIAVAGKWCKRGIDADDCRSAAHLGLIEAVDKFDPAKGRLSTIIWSHVTRRCLEAARERWAIRIPQTNAESPNCVEAAERVMYGMVSFDNMTEAQRQRCEPARWDEERDEERELQVLFVRRRLGALPSAQRRAIKAALGNMAPSQLAREAGVTDKAIQFAKCKGIEKLRAWWERAQAQRA